MKSIGILLGMIAGMTSVAGQTSFTISWHKTFERHTELRWEDMGAEYYAIMRSADGQQFTEVKKITTNRYMDFSDPLVLDTFHYYIKALDGLNGYLGSSDTIKAEEYPMNGEQLMDMVQEYTFRYFWDEAHPTSGLARERNNSGDVVTTGGSGFGIMGLLVGVENGYITRQEAVNRMIKIVSFLQYADRFHGAFPHWLNGKTGKVHPFSTYDNGGDLVETAFLMQGLLAARQFFDQDNSYEQAIRQSITKLYEAVEWDHYSRNNSGVLYWHWSPNYGWQMNFQIRGYNEALIVYLLAIASPTHSVPATYYKTGWTANGYANGNTWFGHKLFVGPPYGGPLFFAHYSFMGFDPRDKRDNYANYFEQNRNHSLINRGYCIYNPLQHKKYSANCWGLTASDDPWGYLAHEPGTRDNGTISPTAALSSMPYTPDESMAALKYFYFNEGDKLFGPSGFYDAFNGDVNWYADSYLAIDQGPLLVMIQNHRTALLWDNFMKNPEIGVALTKIGFQTTNAAHEVQATTAITLYPNPTTATCRIKASEGLTFHPSTTLHITNMLGQTMPITFDIIDSTTIDVHLAHFSRGYYVLMLESNGRKLERRIVVE